jgi:spore maturation protein CgeB
MKILVLCSSIDLDYQLGCTPSWWQLLKSLNEIGNEIIVVPYLGEKVPSPWWDCYPNPCPVLSEISFNFLSIFKKTINLKKNNIVPINLYIQKKWLNAIINIFNKEENIDFVLILNIPIPHISNACEFIKNIYNIPIIYYDGDMPTILPEYADDRGFKFSYYDNSDLSIFDIFLTNSMGVVDVLKNMGCNKVEPFYYAVDPNYFQPINIDKKFDISFYGHGSDLREYWINQMITKPSNVMINTSFITGGGINDVNLGLSKSLPKLSMFRFKKLCCESKICLNITRKSHADVYASSTARPFELAALGCCIISQPYNGINEWFKINEEIICIRDGEHINSLYDYYLENEEERNLLGINARNRILKDHTYNSRANQLIYLINHM